jgi:hypothetical protein
MYRTSGALLLWEPCYPGLSRPGLFTAGASRLDFGCHVQAVTN